MPNALPPHALVLPVNMPCKLPRYARHKVELALQRWTTHCEHKMAGLIKYSRRQQVTVMHKKDIHHDLAPGYVLA
jgi:hypothetical protein